MSRRPKMRKFPILSVLLLLAVISTALLLLPRQETPPQQTLPPETTLQTQATTLPPETTLPETEPPTEPPVVELSRCTITVTGDVMMHIPLINSGYTGSGYNYDKFFRYLTDYVSQSDLAVANLETTLAGPSQPYSGFPKFNCPDEIVDALKTTGFDLILTANNHTFDTGSGGMRRTMEVISQRELSFLGTTAAPEDPGHMVLDVGGIQVGMVCYTYGQIDEATGQKSVNGLPVSLSMTEQINVFDYYKLDRFYGEMEAHIAAMEEAGAEAIVLFIHWGNEYQTYPSSYQTAMAQKLCDLGVDVIAGGHPHVIQPVELLTSTQDPTHRTLCVYSMGNTVSNQRATNMDLDTGHTEDGMLFSFTLVKYSNGLVCLDNAQIIPLWVNRYYGSVVREYDILPLDPNVEDWQSAYAIDGSTLRWAQASYDRTMALISPGMETVNAWLDEYRALRQAEFCLE